MSYIVRASWRGDKAKYTRRTKDKGSAFAFAIVFILSGEKQCHVGTVTITKDGEVIREYKVGERANG